MRTAMDGLYYSNAPARIQALQVTASDQLLNGLIKAIESSFHASEPLKIIQRPRQWCCPGSLCLHILAQHPARCIRSAATLSHSDVLPTRKRSLAL